MVGGLATTKLNAEFTKEMDDIEKDAWFSLISMSLLVVVVLGMAAYQCLKR